MDEKIELSEFRKKLDYLKESSLRSKDHYKFIIGLSTGALVVSVTFIDKFTLLTTYKPFAVVGWMCLIVSIITGVWLLQKRDSLEAQWNEIADLLFGKKEVILFGLEQDLGKFITRSLAGTFLKEEESKDPKNEEKMKTLRREWLTPNGNKGKEFLKRTMSVLAEVYPPLASATPDIIKEVEEWGQILAKGGKLIYLPYKSKRLRKTIKRIAFFDKIMAGFFYAGIILITLSSTISFLQIDLIGVICNLWNNIVSPALSLVVKVRT